MNKDYEIVKSEQKFKGKIIDVICDDIVLPNGEIAKIEVVIRKDACAVVVLDDDKNVIIVSQYRHPAKSIMLEIPAGVMEDGETPKECALRELEEETGIKVDEMKELITIYPTFGFCTEKIHIFFAKGIKKGKINLDEEEFIDVIKMPLDEAIEKIYNGEIVDAKTVAGLLACKKYV